MQVKDKFLEKINILILILSVSFSQNLHADVYKKIFNYNESLKNSSANFIQTNSDYIQEGIIFFGNDRIKITYNMPQNLTIILSPKKGIYINHELEESEFFLTKKSYIKIFFDIFHKEDHIKKMTLNHSKDQIEISENTQLENTLFDIRLIYENDPIKLRRLEIINDDDKIQMGFFNHSIESVFDKNFFSMVDPYLN